MTERLPSTCCDCGRDTEKFEFHMAISGNGLTRCVLCCFFFVPNIVPEEISHRVLNALRATGSFRAQSNICLQCGVAKVSSVEPTSWRFALAQTWPCSEDAPAPVRLEVQREQLLVPCLAVDTAVDSRPSRADCFHLE